MGEGIKATIVTFILLVEKNTKLSFVQEWDIAHLVLRATDTNLSLVIYFPMPGGRIANLSDRTIHIDYDQIVNDRKKICLRLAALLGQGETIFARKTVAARLDKRITLSFLEEHHMQTPLPGKYRYGLYHEGELVSIAVFSGGRHMRDKDEQYRSFELLRFCHKSGHRVVGGLSKLIKSFIDEFSPQDIMTYVDRDWSQASNLLTLGFEEKGNTSAQSYWISDGVRIPIRNQEDLQPLKQTLPLGYLRSNSGSTKLVCTL